MTELPECVEAALMRAEDGFQNSLISSSVTRYDFIRRELADLFIVPEHPQPGQAWLATVKMGQIPDQTIGFERETLD